jgi:hypothetical protein
VDEVVLVGKKLDVLGAGIGAHEDHEVFVSAGGLRGYLAAEVAVNVLDMRALGLWVLSVRRLLKQLGAFEKDARGGDVP